MRIFILLLMCIILSGCTTLSGPDKPFPNSYNIVSGATQVTFTDLPANCTIEIYNISGDPIRKIEVVSGNGQTIWDLKNESGESVKSGVYTYLLTSSQQNLTGKIVVTR